MARKWKKVLYDRQGVPDNYVDETFLSNLRKNVNLYQYSLWEAFIGVSSVTHEVSCTVLFIIIFIFLDNETYSIFSIAGGFDTLIILSVLIHQMTCSIDNRWTLKDCNLLESLKSCILFLMYGDVFSPLLKDLTTTISTDTIYAMVTLMMLTHVLFQDYGADAAGVSSSLSFTSALFSAVCLSSRLPTVQHTFVLMIFAIKIFVFIPVLRKTFQKNVKGMLIITSLHIVTVLFALYYLSFPYMVLFAVLCVFCNILFPVIFVYFQKYKENIFGPWDEAVVKQQKIS